MMVRNHNFPFRRREFHLRDRDAATNQDDGSQLYGSGESVQEIVHMNCVAFPPTNHPQRAVATRR